MSDAPETTSTVGKERPSRLLRQLDLADEAIRRFLDDNDLPIPDTKDGFQAEVLEQLTDEQILDLIQQYKFAGRTTVNYFVVTGLSDYEFEKITSAAEEHFPEQDEVEGISREPFIAESEVLNGRLYLTLGYYKTSGEQNVRYGTKTSDLITKRAVVVIREDTDLIEVRTSDTNMAEDIRDEIGKSLGIHRGSNIYRPDFGEEFQNKFDELVEKYTNLKVQLEEKEGTTVDVISFTSREDESGERRDARKDERVKKELDRPGSQITMGYVVLTDGFRFQLNRKQSKISIRKVEREDRITQITEIIDNVLRQTEAYSQGTLRGVTDVPE